MLLTVTSAGKLLSTIPHPRVSWEKPEEAAETFADMIKNPSCLLDIVEAYPDGMPVQLIADKLGLDKSRVEIALASALKKVKEEYENAE